MSRPLLLEHPFAFATCFLYAVGGVAGAVAWSIANDTSLPAGAVNGLWGWAVGGLVGWAVSWAGRKAMVLFAARGPNDAADEPKHSSPRVWGVLLVLYVVVLAAAAGWPTVVLATGAGDASSAGAAITRVVMCEFAAPLGMIAAAAPVLLLSYIFVPAISGRGR